MPLSSLSPPNLSRTNKIFTKIEQGQSTPATSSIALTCILFWIFMDYGVFLCNLLDIHFFFVEVLILTWVVTRFASSGCWIGGVESLDIRLLK